MAEEAKKPKMIWTKAHLELVNDLYVKIDPENERMEEAYMRRVIRESKKKNVINAEVLELITRVKMIIMKRKDKALRNAEKVGV